jgi:hypothetical protein
MSGYSRHNTGNLEVELVSFLTHREGGAMVHPQHGKCDCDWGKLRDDFCHSFSPLYLTLSPWSDILAFELFEKESLGAAWARFLHLLTISPSMPLSLKCPCTSFAWV